MSRLLVRRRKDGIVQLRRPSAWHLLADPVLLVVLGVCAACAAVMAAIALIGTAVPITFGLTLPLVALGLWAGRSVRDAVLAPAPVPTKPRPPLRVA